MASPPPDGDQPAKESAPSLKLISATFKQGVKTKIKVGSTGIMPSGLIRGDVKIVATGASTRGALILGDCDHKGKTALALVPGKKTSKTVIAPLSSAGQICVTATVTTKLVITVRSGWMADGTKLTVSDGVTIFDSAATGRVPSPTQVFKIRFDGSQGIPKGVRYLLVWVAGTADKPTGITAGKCGRKRTEFARLEPGSDDRIAVLLKIDGTEVCIGATNSASVEMEVVGYG